MGYERLVVQGQGFGFGQGFLYVGIAWLSLYRKFFIFEQIGREKENKSIILN